MPTYIQWLRLMAENALNDFQKEVRYSPTLRGLGTSRYYAVIAGGRPWEPNHGQDEPTSEFRTEVVLGSRLCADSGPPTDYQEQAEQAIRMAFATHVTGLKSDQLVLPINSGLWRQEWGIPFPACSAQYRPDGSNIAFITAVSSGNAQQNNHATGQLLQMMLKWIQAGHQVSEVERLGTSITD